jgi:hypothetical protein
MDWKDGTGGLGFARAFRLSLIWKTSSRIAVILPTSLETRKRSPEPASGAEDVDFGLNADEKAGLLPEIGRLEGPAVLPIIGLGDENPDMDTKERFATSIMSLRSGIGIRDAEFIISGMMAADSGLEPCVSRKLTIAAFIAIGPFPVAHRLR